MKDRADGRGEIHRRGGAHTLFRLDPAERQEIADETVHPARLALHDGQKALARRAVVAGGPQQCFDEPHERGQRRAQFVADIGDEIAAHLEGFLHRRAILEGDEDLAARQPGAGRLKRDVAAGFGRQVLRDGAALGPDRLLDRVEQRGLAQDGDIVAPRDGPAEKRARPGIGRTDPAGRFHQQGRDRDCFDEVLRRHAAIPCVSYPFGIAEARAGLNLQRETRLELPKDQLIYRLSERKKYNRNMM